MAHVPFVRLASVPTPIRRYETLGRRLGLDLWVKRDDMTGGAEAGNKIRKLEFLLADAVARGADTIVTCGGIQSNHARATALCAAQLGLKTVLLLRTPDTSALPPPVGNVLLDRLAGARIVLVTPDEYRERGRRMDEEADRIRAARGRPYVIPEGGSNGLGALGYVAAMAEVRVQLDEREAVFPAEQAPDSFDVVACACGSGGTAAGLAVGAAAFGVADEVRAFAVCDDRAHFESAISRIVAEARALEPARPAPAPVVVDDSAKGPAYAVASEEQLRFVVEVARATGLVLDPVYTGKALFGLASAARRDPGLLGRRALFVHTGGLPGLLAQGDAFAGEI